MYKQRISKEWIGYSWSKVKVTLGPKENVLLQKQHGRLHITKDGVSVEKEIELEDVFENMGPQLVKEVPKTDENGDGTTT